MVSRSIDSIPEDSIYELKKSIPVVVNEVLEVTYEAKIESPGQSPDVTIYSCDSGVDESVEHLTTDILLQFERHNNYNVTERKSIHNSKLASLNQYLREK